MSRPLSARGNGATSHEERAQRDTGGVAASLERLAGHLEGAAAAVRELAQDLDIQLADLRPASLMSAVPPTPTPGAELLTADDLADRLRVSAKTVRRWRSEGRLPEAIEIAGVLRWRRVEFEQWLAEVGS